MPATPEVVPNLTAALGHSALFRGMEERVLRNCASQATLLHFDSGERLTAEGTPADAFFVLLNGKASARIRRPGRSEDTEIAPLGPADTFGEVALLLAEPYGASVVAAGPVVAARFPSSIFDSMAASVPGFGLSLARALARRLQQTMRQVPLPDWDEDAGVPAADVVALLPIEFVRRHRVLPVRSAGDQLTLGFVDAPAPAVMESVRSLVPGAEVRPVHISASYFESAAPVRATSVHEEEGAGDKPVVLEVLLRLMVAEGASDLHLQARNRPRWRIDGRISEVPGYAPLSGNTVFELLVPLIDKRWTQQFVETNDADFSYSLDDGPRFRVNLFRDTNGVGAVFRHIPVNVPDLATLGMPDVVGRLCAEPKGLILVTGPTGSGKSTTLAAMVDLINRTRQEHVLTLEDPVEFLHTNKASLVNQREIGSHTVSFGRALRAALREDPDIVLVGEMRDLETIGLAMETANTGHLVLATLHTATAALTIDRIVGMFPPEEQPQIRSTLADVLRAVICQNLCRKIGGGRVAALEIMIVNPAISNLIRESKTVQIASIMQTAKAAGNQLLNESLATLVKSGKIAPEEAMSKAVDRVDLTRRLGGSA